MGSGKVLTLTRFEVRFVVNIGLLVKENRPDNYPPHWDKLDRYINRNGKDFAVLRRMDFHCGDPGDLNQFAGRYCAAKSFKGGSFDGYTPGSNVPDAYSALLRLVLAWSAFESFLPLIGIPRHKQITQGLSDTYGGRDIVRDFHASQAHRTVFFHVHNSLDSRSKGLRSQILRFIQGDPTADAIKLAQALRHVFTHGKLSATTMGDATINADIARQLSGLLLTAMEREFLLRLLRYGKKDPLVKVCPECLGPGQELLIGVACYTCGGTGSVVEWP